MTTNCQLSVCLSVERLCYSLYLSLALSHSHSHSHSISLSLSLCLYMMRLPILNLKLNRPQKANGQLVARLATVVPNWPGLCPSHAAPAPAEVRTDLAPLGNLHVLITDRLSEGRVPGPSGKWRVSSAESWGQGFADAKNCQHGGVGWWSSCQRKLLHAGDL